MKPRLVAIPARPAVRVYLRRSKGDDQQTHSIDVQRSGCARFAAGLSINFGERVEYLDDDRAGDDFLGRPELKRLLDEARPGDVVICRDQSRIGRKATQTTLVIEELVQERGARLFFYADRREVAMTNALDSAMVFVPGIAHQTELESIRKRTAEALQERVRSGRLAGGRCYGYRNIQNPDREGRRKNTVAVVDPEQAKIVLRIFTWYSEGRGLVWIAKRLNAEHVTTPSYGNRGTGSWAPSAIRSMLKNVRYIGLHVHGRVERSRKGGRRLTIRADESRVIRIDVPEWRIIPEPLWNAVQARFAAQAHLVAARGNPWRAGHPRHPLSGLGRCARCGGPITVTTTKRGRNTIQAYSCAYAKKRGETVCNVSIRQPRDVVERAIVAYLLDNVLTPQILEQITARVVELAQQDCRRDAVPVERLEEELSKLRKEQKRYAAAVAEASDVPDLLAELRKRQERIRSLEATIATARAAPGAARIALDTLAGEIAGAFERLRQGLVGSPDEARQALRALFPRGLYFEPEGNHWAVTGAPRIEMPVTSPAFATPAGFEPAFVA